MNPIVVAGHICLDIIPAFPANLPAVEFQPGHLFNIGPALLSTGGAVANTGLALHYLGLPVRLAGRLGADVFGQVVLDLLRHQGPGLDRMMMSASGETTSYTIVLSPPGVDRIFFHCPGANDSFDPADIPDETLRGAGLLHFGYPPLMRRVYADTGASLSSLFARARRQGLRTSLDLALPDPASEAGQVDWLAFLRQVLPLVDLFLPSLDELRFMLQDQPLTLAPAALDSSLLERLSAACLEMGAGLVAIKLGDQGVYLRSSAASLRLPASYRGRQLLAPCYSVKVVGTTGSGDCTIAGFLAALALDLPLEEALAAACASGACCCEAPDALSGIPAWAALKDRLARPWPRLPVRLPLPGWRWDLDLWRGPQDQPGLASFPG